MIAMPNTTSLDETGLLMEAGFGLEGRLVQETLSGVCDPKERVDMTNQKKQSSEAAVREIRRRTLVSVVAWAGSERSRWTSS
jgi:hypothetical protein